MENLYKRGLELLRQRENTSMPALDELLNKLTPIASTFFKYYNTGDWISMFGEGETVNLPDIGICGVAVNKWFENKVINGSEYEDYFGYLLPVTEILFEFKELESRSEIWHQLGMIKIGMMAQWDIILLGVEESNRDKVFIYGEGAGADKVHYFAEDIFALFSDVNQYYSDEDIKDYTKGAIDGSLIYKDWGQHSWKIRESNQQM